MTGEARITSGTPTVRCSGPRTRCTPRTTSPQPGTLVRKVLSEQEKAHLVSNVAGHLSTVEQPILDRALADWRSADKTLGDQIAGKVGNPSRVS